jgi:hypothetical protein
MKQRVFLVKQKQPIQYMAETIISEFLELKIMTFIGIRPS